MVKLGIVHERIEPGHHEQNGRHERMHRTLKQEATKPPSANARAQQKRFDAFRAELNNERPHEALGDEVPSSSYARSPRSLPRRLPEVTYPAHYITRKVAASGRIRWNYAMITIGHALEGELIGIERADEMHRVYFANLQLGFIDDRRPELGLIKPPTKCWARVR